MTNFTQHMSPSATDSKVSSQSENILGSVSLTFSSALTLATRASEVAKLTSQGDFFSSTFSTYLRQDVSSSMGESLTFVPWVSDSLSKSKPAMLEGVQLFLNDLTDI